MKKTQLKENLKIATPNISSNAFIADGAKIIEIRYKFILKTIRKVLVSHSMASSSFDGGRAS